MAKQIYVNREFKLLPNFMPYMTECSEMVEQIKEELITKNFTVKRMIQ